MLSENLLVRNAILLGILAIGSLATLARPMHAEGLRKVKRPTYQDGHIAPGFTLIETLLVIVLIGILIALTLPHLAGARDVAREISSLSMVRGHGQVMQIYSVDYAGYYPVFLDPDKPTTLRFAGRESIVRDYWLADILWRRALLDQYYDGNLAHASFFPPGATYGEAGGIAFRYTESYLAVPDFWDAATRTGRPQWRAVPAASTAYPAKKGLVTSWARVEPVPGKIATYYSPHDMTQDTAFVDGSAKTVKLADFLPWMRTGEGMYPGRQTTPFGWPVLHTMQGALGRDIQ